MRSNSRYFLSQATSDVFHEFNKKFLADCHPDLKDSGVKGSNEPSSVSASSSPASCAPSSSAPAFNLAMAPSHASETACLTAFQVISRSLV